MTRDQRKALKDSVSAGLDIAAAAAQLNLSMSEVRKSGKRFAKELDEAYVTGTSRLRGRLLKAALTSDDAKAISALLEQRAISAAADTGITRIERVILPGHGRCLNCGKPPGQKPAPGKPTNGQAATSS